MVRYTEGALTPEERQIVKGLLDKRERNQDIQALINLGRKATVNSGRITEVKQDNTIIAANDDELEFFKLRKKSFDPQTGLNLYDDERLIRSREAMLLAVQVFNSPTLRFKAEVFSVQANIAWTYLLHEYYLQEDEEIIQNNGQSLLLSQMINRADCPLSQGIKDNLRSLKEIRDAVEHTLFRRSDIRFLAIFQACCLNFDKTISELFGAEKALSNELSFSLQFAKMDLDQLAQVHDYDVPPHIMALEREIEDGLDDNRLSDVEYRFRVVYTFENSTKSKAHIKFVHPSEEGADEVRNVLIKQVSADSKYPHKAKAVSRLVSEKSGRKFMIHNHTQAWKRFNTRPKSNVNQPENTNKDYCIYHAAHRDYTYSDDWVEYLVDFITSDENYEELKKYKM